MKQPRFVTMLGIGCITMAVLATEIALTRIFSVTLWYHFAFLVISLALLFSGVGSYWSQRVRVERIVPNLRAGLVVLIALILLYALALPAVLNATQGLRVELRALVVVLLLMPAGLLMGRPFPLGLRHIEAVGAGGMMPWLWAANGTLSVVGSVLATLLAIQVGFAAVFSAGVLAYTLALGISLRFGAQTAANKEAMMGEAQAAAV